MKDEEKLILNYSGEKLELNVDDLFFVCRHLDYEQFGRILTAILFYFVNGNKPEFTGSYTHENELLEFAFHLLIPGAEEEEEEEEEGLEEAANE